MKYLIIILLFTCAFAAANAQVNFVKNPDFEDVKFCPHSVDQIDAAKYWEAVDSTGAISIHGNCRAEYYHSCASDIRFRTPDCISGYQIPHSGKGMIGAHLFCDETPPPPAPYYYYRDYPQGRLFSNLTSGREYCVTFFVNMTESSSYAHNKIGAYLDDGSIDTVNICSKPITFITPQIFSDLIIDDTGNWTKIEGSFIANGKERFITLGNFFAKSAITSFMVPGFATYDYSYYFIDDVSVIPIDLPADAGKDTWVELGKQVQIGRVGDTTAIGLDCKWYHKGLLIDSGAIISVNASSIKNAIDTYVVVQTICGIVKSDTVLVKTTGLGIKANSAANTFSIYPNPSSGTLVITSTSLRGVARNEAKQSEAKIYDLLGRIIHQQNLSFSNQAATIKLNIPNGSYILELRDEDGNNYRERIVIE